MANNTNNAKERNFAVDLHCHPHFYSPQSGRKVTSLLEIVDYLFRERVSISALSACHPDRKNIDYRFMDYMEQLPSLDRDFSVDYREDSGWLAIARKKPAQNQPLYIAILNSQEVRTVYKGLSADINVLCVPEIIGPGQDIDETAKRAMGEGGIVLVCHPASRAGAGLEKAIEMLQEKKVHGIEGHNAFEKPETNLYVMGELEKRGIMGLAVSDAHGLQMGTAYIEIDSPVYGSFKVDSLKEAIVEENFDVCCREVDRFTKFRTHTLPILKGMAWQSLTNFKPLYRALKKRKQD